MSVKLSAFLSHLQENNCSFHRPGSKHDIWRNLITGKKTTIPRHAQIDKHLSEAICKQLQIPKLK